MKYKKYIFVLILTLFIGCNNAYAEECYYQTSDKKTLIQYNTNTNKFSIDSRDAELVEQFKGEKLINSGKEHDDKKETGIVVEQISINTCPTYIVYRHKYRALWPDSEGIFGFNNNTKATDFYNASNNINKVKAWKLSKNNANGTKITATQYNNNLKTITTSSGIGTSNPNFGIEGTGEKTNVNCESLFGSKNDPNSIRYIVDEILQYPRIIVPMLVILLGALDFGKAVISGKEDEIKKIKATFVKRVIAGVGLYFVPVIVDLIMVLADIVWEGLGYTSCGI